MQSNVVILEKSSAIFSRKPRLSLGGGEQYICILYMYIAISNTGGDTQLFIKPKHLQVTKLLSSKVLQLQQFLYFSEITALLLLVKGKGSDLIKSV